LEAVKGVKSVSQLGSEYEAHPIQIGIWKRNMKASPGAKGLPKEKRSVIVLASQHEPSKDNQNSCSNFSLLLDIYERNPNKPLSVQNYTNLLSTRNRALIAVPDDSYCGPLQLAQSLYNDKNNTIDEICKTLNISRATLYRYIKVSSQSRYT
jgi:hypothetical protein